MKGDAPGIGNRDVCAACGQPIYDDHWVILGNRKIIHHGGKYRDECYRKINGLWSRSDSEGGEQGEYD